MDTYYLYVRISRATHKPHRKSEVFHCACFVTVQAIKRYSGQTGVFRTETSMGTRDFR